MKMGCVILHSFYDGEAFGGLIPLFCGLLASSLAGRYGFARG